LVLPINEDDFKYILSHFEPPQTPRRYSTWLTKDGQWVAETFDEMLQKFEEAKNIDCKVNCYNYLGKWRKTTAPSLSQQQIATTPNSVNYNSGGGNVNGHNYTEYQYDIGPGLYNNANDITKKMTVAEQVEEAAKLIQLKAMSEQAPTCLFIDLDERSALPRTRRRIKDVFMDDDLEPGILDTGNGLHLLLPIETDPEKYPTGMDYQTKDDLIPGRTMDSARLFALYYDNNPANVSPGSTLLRCAAEVLTNKKADKKNHPSVRSCLVRAPGSLNSKLVLKHVHKPVSIVQRGSWEQGKKGHIMSLLPYHSSWIKQQREKHIKMLAQARNKRLRLEENKEVFRETRHYYLQHNSSAAIEFLHLKYWYIETMLRTPLDDFRKQGVNLLLAPYLLNIKQMPYEIAKSIILQWLSVCNKVRYLDFDAIDRTCRGLDYAKSRGYKPLDFDRIPEFDSVVHVKLLRLRSNYYQHQHVSTSPPPPLPPASSLIGGN
jgi:hypothetical protein